MIDASTEAAAFERYETLIRQADNVVIFETELPPSEGRELRIGSRISPRVAGCGFVAEVFSLLLLGDRVHVTARVISGNPD